MATGTSVFLIALGAILTFAVDAELSGISLDTVGVILMIAGAIGVVVYLVWANRAGDAGSTRVVEEHHH